MTRPRKGELDGCRRCDLWRNATQGVPGRGPRRAALMLVGEQPGDEEDLRGRAFVGPAGRLHKRPNAAEIAACNAWLLREIRSQRPAVILCLGATATRAVARAFASPITRRPSCAR